MLRVVNMILPGGNLLRELMPSDNSHSTAGNAVRISL
jgi:hypothetical protein